MKDLSELLQKLKLDAEQTKTLDFNVADSIITALQSKQGKAFLFPAFTFFTPWLIKKVIVGNKRITTRIILTIAQLYKNFSIVLEVGNIQIHAL